MLLVVSILNFRQECIYDMDRMNCDIFSLVFIQVFKIVHEIMLVNFSHISLRKVILFLREFCQYSFFFYIYKCLCKVLICSNRVVLLFYVNTCFSCISENVFCVHQYHIFPRETF